MRRGSGGPDIVKVGRDLCALRVGLVHCGDEETEGQRVEVVFPRPMSSLPADAVLEARLVVPALLFSGGCHLATEPSTSTPGSLRVKVSYKVLVSQ